MTHDRSQIEQVARAYTEAWCSDDVGRIADHYAPGGAIVFNGRERVGIEEVANYSVAAFPDGEIFMDDLVFRRILSNTTGHSPARERRQASGYASLATRSGRSAPTA